MNNKSQFYSSSRPEKVFLFLQGHPSHFGRKLADELERIGHKVLKINFCAGDTLYWFGRKNVAYRGRINRWPGFLRGFARKNQVTDIVYYGDQLPYHRIARQIGGELGIGTFAYEFGYLRPDWITLEHGGLSAYSHFPENPDTIRTIARQFGKPDLEIRFPYSNGTELFHEVSYNLFSALLSFAYPFYRPDRYYNVFLEYLSGIPGQFLKKRDSRRAQAVIHSVLQARKTFFLFPLQLQCDSQLRHNAPFAHQKDAIDYVMRSFSQHADPDDLLIFKQHPLDNGWEQWPKVITESITNHGLEGRVHFINGGDLNTLLNKAKGCVVINSTVGLSALQAGCPVKVLGTGIYDIDGLCHKGCMDSFWQKASIPDPALTAALVRALAGTIQIKGNFFTTKGQSAAIPVMANMLSKGLVNGAGAFMASPPRLKQPAD